MKRLSVVVPVYKAEKYIQECVNSILPQLSADDELILVDDGSPDRSGTICDEIAGSNENVVALHQQNGGVSCARNAGLAKAKGEFLMFVDSDDALTEDAIETLQPYFSDDSWDLLIFGNKRIQTGKTTEVKPSGTMLYDRAHFALQYGDFCKSFIISSPCNKVYWTEILRKNGIAFDESISLGEDLLFNNAVIRYSNRIQTVAKAIYRYYEREEESLTRRYRGDLFEIYQRLYCDSMDTLLRLGGANRDSYEIKALYYRQFKDAICNIWSNRSTDTAEQKMKRTKRALNSREVRECLPFAGKKDVLWNLIRFKCVMLIRWYVGASRWKEKRKRK